MTKTPRATIDFETRSAADIRQGSWMYARHHTTRILCLSFTLPGDEEASLWGAPMGPHSAGVAWGRPLSDLFDWIRAGGLVEAHNAMFELCVWKHIATSPAHSDENGATGMGAPPIDIKQWRCSAAKAAAYALPRSLDGCGQALNLGVLKDLEGGKIMKRLCKPAKVPKDGEDWLYDDDNPYYVPYDAQEFDRLYRYCCTDVMSEHAISEALDDLTPFEYKVWLADLRANLRGVRVDVALCHAALEVELRVKAKFNRELKAITGIPSGTKRKDLLQWMQAHGVDIYDTAAPTLDWLMDPHREGTEGLPAFTDYPRDVQRVVFITRNSNRTSVKKYDRILKCMDPEDQRVRELVMYHGAATGRWSGKGIQVQNFPRGDLKGLSGRKKITMSEAVEDVKSMDLEWLEEAYGDVLALLSSTLRGALVPQKGRVFYVADYAAIEARVVLWLAGATKALEVFIRGEDIYCDMAGGIYGRPINKEDHPGERQFGKVTILGLGYGMGFLTFLLTLRGYDLKFTQQQAYDILGKRREKYVQWVKDRLWPKAPDLDAMKSDKARQDATKRYRTAVRQASADRRRLVDSREVPENIIHELALCKFVVDAYRAKYPEVKELWSLQEKAATDAVIARDKEHAAAEEDFRDPELKPIVCGRVTWVVEGRFLMCILPSGRALRYCDPEVKWEPTPWGEKRAQLRFMGVHKKTKKWSRMATYGGSIVENIDQASSRDIMAFAMVAVDEGYCEQRYPYEPVTTIHDELLAEANEGTGDKDEFEHLLEALPPGYDGCPIKAEGAMLLRYQK